MVVVIAWVASKVIVHHMVVVMIVGVVGVVVLGGGSGHLFQHGRTHRLVVMAHRIQIVG